MYLLNVSTNSYYCQEISFSLALPQGIAYFLKIKYIGKRKLGKCQNQNEITFPPLFSIPYCNWGLTHASNISGAENSKGPPGPSPSNVQQAGPLPRDSEVLGRELQGNGPQNCVWALSLFCTCSDQTLNWLLQSLNELRKITGQIPHPQ